MEVVGKVKVINPEQQVSASFKKELTEKPLETGCKGFKYMTDCGWEYDCEYNTTITCEECKYCDYGGKKDPNAKRNQIKE